MENCEKDAFIQNDYRKSDTNSARTLSSSNDLSLFALTFKLMLRVLDCLYWFWIRCKHACKSSLFYSLSKAQRFSFFLVVFVHFKILSPLFQIFTTTEVVMMFCAAEQLLLQSLCFLDKLISNIKFC